MYNLTFDWQVCNSHTVPRIMSRRMLGFAEHPHTMPQTHIPVGGRRIRMTWPMVGTGWFVRGPGGAVTTRQREKPPWNFKNRITEVDFGGRSVNPDVKPTKPTEGLTPSKVQVTVDSVRLYKPGVRRRPQPSEHENRVTGIYKKWAYQQKK